MNPGKTIFAQLLQQISHYQFRKIVDQYKGSHRIRSFSCWDQFIAMAFAQLTGRDSLRDIESCLSSHREKLYHMGLRSLISRSTLVDANEHRDFRIYQDFGYSLIKTARELYQGESLAIELEKSLHALDSTTIDLCLLLFPWATFRKTKAAVKMHTSLDLRRSIPTFIHVSTGKVHDVTILDTAPLEPDSIITMDRAYLDFTRLYAIHRLPAFFVIRAKSNLRYRRLISHKADKAAGVRADQVVALVGPRTKKAYPESLRRISYCDATNDKRLVFLTNLFAVPAKTVANIYRQRWRVELFFKWIKQHLRIKAFFGTSANAVKTQIWIAIIAYLLVAIAKKKLNLPGNLHTILQILEVNVFEKRPIIQVVSDAFKQEHDAGDPNQLKLFSS